MLNYIDGFSGRCLPFRLSDFFQGLGRVLDRYSSPDCGGKLLLDEFVLIAYLAEKALKHIVESPSVKIIKVDTKIQANKLRSSGIKTMNYLAKRSGQTIKEKIAPDNKVLTALTRFSVDTPENRQSMYLLDRLQHILESKLEGSPCKSCKNKDAECYKVTERIKRILRLRADVRKGELSDVKKEKQSIQNNKLMCDKYYKLVWDSSKLLESTERKITESWPLLQKRYETLILWLTVAKLLSHSNARIIDRIEALADGSEISFAGRNDITLIIENDDTVDELVFRKNDDGYICNRQRYRINTASATQRSTQTLPLSDFLTKFFDEQTETA